MALLLAPALSQAAEETASPAPSVPFLLLWSLPFVLILLSIALLPLLPRVAHWWERNRNKLRVALGLSFLMVFYYLFRPAGFDGAAAGLGSVGRMLKHSVLDDYVPFIVLLFSLFTISGGIRLTGDVPAHPATNVLILFVGAILASLIGTTGASMVLIRPLLQINSERKHVKHTVVFFIFLVSNIGGCLLPVGDPPLFLGYLRGVPFLWTLHLAPEWLAAVLTVLAIYWALDSWVWRHEDVESLRLDEAIREPLRLHGWRNLALLAGVVGSVALLVPGRPLPLIGWRLPDLFLREIVQGVLCAVSLWITPKKRREDNQFTFHAIAEVACLFVGIFITMQAPIELLDLQGARLGLNSPMHFFWASGALSSFLDNAPTYVVFFEAASHLHAPAGVPLLKILAGGGRIPMHLLEAISLGSVFMGANTYIGNGPNFLVKSIAEHHGVRMPSFFGYMVYSGLVLIPTFIVLSLVFFK